MTVTCQALQAMFQLIMQEGWSEVMSEAMCHDKKWIAINFYFILLHLIASLVRQKKYLFTCLLIY